MEQTLALIKSGALKREKASEILDRIEAAGFEVMDILSVPETRVSLMRELYREHEGRPYFDGLMDSVTGGAVALVLRKENAITDWRALMGPTDPVKARETAPTSLRAIFGLGLPYNAVHGSDSPESAQREIEIFFPRHHLQAAA